jgi:transcriptional regulator with XRE-family HTH domain
MKGTELKEMRELGGLSQTAVANYAVVDRSMLSLAESELRSLALDQEERVIKVLKKALEQRAKKISALLESV